MKVETWVAVRSLFEQAIELPRAERSAFLDKTCRGQPEVRAEVDRLLRLDQDPGESFGGDRVLLAAFPPPRSGMRIGRYTIVRMLASGGMGMVFEAVQDHPRRTVALKTLRLGLGSSTRLARFQLETAVLGSLRHPSIAQIYDAGMHDCEGERFPYFAMELVAGARDILSYAREEGPSLERRIELFLAVCDAVHHGHQKGVIHRDLKPGNLLIDAEGRVKVIDFGVARVTSPEDAGTPRETQAGQMVGTLQYMSPEQLSGDPDQVDVRTDVYALGVVLHELLTGSPPYELDGVPLEEALRRVRESIPSRPRSLPGDLGWILRKALEKEPERRYAAVSELAADLRRFLAHEPVLAGPPSAPYHLAKFARRHRLGLGATAAVIAALAIGLVRAEASARSESRARAEAEELARAEARARKQAEDLALSETRARQDAERQSRKAGWVNGFLTRTLTSVSPELQGRDARVTDILDEASRTAETLGEEDPEIRAMVDKVIGDSYGALGLFEEAEPHLAAARDFAAQHLERSSPFALEILGSWAQHLYSTRRLAEAEALARELLPVAEESVGPAADQTLHVRGTLTSVLRMLDRLDEAEDLADTNLRLIEERHGDSDERLVPHLCELAQISLKRGKSHVLAASDHAQRALALCRETLPADHYRGQQARLLLARIFVQEERYSEAEPIWREVRDWYRARLGENHPVTFSAVLNHASALYGIGDFQGAHGAFRQAVAMADSIYGQETPEGIRARANLSLACGKLGLGGEGVTWARQALEIGERILPPSHRTLLKLRASLASAMDACGSFAEAEALFRGLLPDAEAAYGPAEPFVLDIVTGIADTLASQSDLEGVREMARELDRRAPGDAAREAFVRSLIEGLEAGPSTSPAGPDLPAPPDQGQ